MSINFFFHKRFVQLLQYNAFRANEIYPVTQVSLCHCKLCCNSKVKHTRNVVPMTWTNKNVWYKKNYLTVTTWATMNHCAKFN